jgi:hypothetical protein
MRSTTRSPRGPRCVALLLCALVLAGCLPAVAFRELTYRPSRRNPYGIWGAHVTDSGLLLLCGSVDNGREDSMERVSRVYNLELRLEETLDPARAGEIQVVQIDGHPSLIRTKGYLRDLCQFDEKRATRRPDETGWTDVFLSTWKKGYSEVSVADLDAGRLPTPPATPRVVIYPIVGSDPPEYLLMGRLRENGPDWTVRLVLGTDHIAKLW